MAKIDPAPAHASRRKLGRGLGSLISAPVQVEVPTVPAAAAPVVHPAAQAQQAPAKSNSPPRDSGRSDAAAVAAGSLASPAGDTMAGAFMLAIDKVQPNPRQPRQHFDEDALASLAASIQRSGLMQPIVVRLTGPAHEPRYEIIAGERRWRAAQRVGLASIPAIVRQVDDRTAAEFSLIENLQREDLNPMERAEAFARLIEDFGLTHQAIADQVALDRTSITNHLRLNELDAQTKEAVRSGLLSMGQARALLAVTNSTRRAELAGQCVREGWSVRETERRVRAVLDAGGGGGEGAGGAAAGAGESRSGASVKVAPPHMMDLEKRLGAHLGTKVRVQTGRAKGSGKLVIDFYSLDQFEGLLQRLDFVGD